MLAHHAHAASHVDVPHNGAVVAFIASDGFVRAVNCGGVHAHLACKNVVAFTFAQVPRTVVVCPLHVTRHAKHCGGMILYVQNIQ